MLSHGISTYQDLVHVPLIIKYPNNRAEVITDMVSGVDLMPTVLDLTGYPPPPGVQGRSLLKSGTETRNVIAESYPSQMYFKFNARFQRVERAIFEGSRKLIASTAGKRELYDIATDQREMNNLFASEKDLAVDLLSKLDRSLQTAIASGPAAPSGAAKSLNKGDVDRLKSLGYVQ
jgi:arylsulfatase A-like enzyme